MKHKNKKAIKVLFMLIVIMVFFAYGVGVGEYQWPPYDVIRSVARAFSEGITGVRSSVKKDGASYTI